MENPYERAGKIEDLILRDLEMQSYSDFDDAFNGLSNLCKLYTL